MNYAATDPLSRWTGLGRPLHALEVDYNFYNLDTRVATLEASITTTVSIASVTQPTATQMQINLSNSASYTLTMPTATFVDRGAWLPDTDYFVNDTFTANGSLYRVVFPHTSASTFSPTANDGAGHDYYATMLSNPGNALPTGGAPGMSLKKSSSTDYAASWGFALPNGGSTHQALLKSSNADQAFAWTTLTASIVNFSPPTGSPLTATDVDTAINQLATLAGSGGGASALASLSDVAFPTGSPAPNDLLQFDGANWTSTSLEFAGALSTQQLRNNAVTALNGLSAAPSLNPNLGDVFTLTPSVDMTIAAAVATAGAEITLIVTTSGATSRAISFGVNFKSQGPLNTGTATGKVFTVKFVGDGTNLNEVGRTTAM